MANNNGIFDEQIINIKAQTEGFNEALAKVKQLQDVLSKTIPTSLQKYATSNKSLSNSLKDMQDNVEKLDFALKVLKEDEKAISKAREQYTKAVSTRVNVGDARNTLRKNLSHYYGDIETIRSELGGLISDILGREQVEKQKEMVRLAQEEAEAQKKSADAVIEKIANKNELIAKQKEENRLAEAQKALADLTTTLDPTEVAIAKVSAKLNEAKQRFVELYEAGSGSAMAATLRVKELSKELDKLQNGTKKQATWFGKLWGRIRNISIYRMIRSAIKWLTSGVTEGMQGLSQFSAGYDKSLSNIKNSLGQIRNTLAISFTQILTALEPIITMLSDKLVDFVNAFNLALSNKMGQPYVKAKKSADLYSKSAEKANKLSFDTFEVLSGGSSGEETPTKELFENGDTKTDESPLSKIFEHVFDIIKQIYNIVKKIVNELLSSGIIEVLLNMFELALDVVSKIVTWLTDSGVIDVAVEVIREIFEALSTIADYVMPKIKDILNIIMPVIKVVLMQISSALQMITGIMQILFAMSNIVGDFFKGIFTGNWESFKNTRGQARQGLSNIGSGFTGMFKSFGALKDYSFYANGGIPDKSELFFMNEYGRPEAFVKTGGSQTNVINLDQISQATYSGMVRAVYDTGLLNIIEQSGQETIIVDKDVLGRAVASSSGFRNEVNRRNTSLNLR